MGALIWGGIGIAILVLMLGFDAATPHAMAIFVGVWMLIGVCLAIAANIDWP